MSPQLQGHHQGQLLLFKTLDRKEHQDSPNCTPLPGGISPDPSLLGGIKYDQAQGLFQILKCCESLLIQLYRGLLGESPPKLLFKLSGLQDACGGLAISANL